ncbi:MAG: prolyl oligopeptidase family serine peptidase, partial [Parabacteroides sp.]|nr:prolyl oligopeptidase family serine peptidase [Parabacteroides sp.]
MKKETMLFLLGLCVSICMWRGDVAKAQVTRADYLRADTILKCANLVYSPAVHPEWIDSSHYFWYKTYEKKGDFYYLVNAENGKKERAKDKKGLARFFSKKQKQLAESLLKEEKEQPRRRYRDDKPEPVVSPDKQWKAYIKDHNLYISPNLDDQEKEQKKEEIALTMDGVAKLRYDGWSICWSPDSRKIATVKVRDVEERRIPLLESTPTTQRQPILQWRDYAKPGDVLPVSFPVLFDVSTRKQIPVDVSMYENQYALYLTGWREDSRAFTFEYNQRGHQRYVIGEINAHDGTVRHLVDEQVRTFIYYYSNYRYDLNDGKELLWISERDGWRHLYLIDGTNGKVKRQVTQGNWVVRRVDYVDEARREVYFFASGLYEKEDPYNLHYCRISLDGTGFTDLTPENGNHHVVVSKDRAFFTDVYSRPDLPAVSLLRRTVDGSVVSELQRCDIRELQATGWQMPEVFCAKGRDGKTDIWGNIYRPINFDASQSYPVVEMIYAGPHDSHVDKDFKPANHLISKLVELGFIVVSIDGMGTANRSKAFHDVCWKNLKDAGFPDRIAWIKAAADKYPSMNLEKVGIYGWSAGGQNAMAALLFHPDFYKVAVALCGCHDNRMDKIWWNEQWMGYPLDESYSASSNVDNAHLLKGKLLLINGELDDNVDPASTLQVVSALMKANKNFDQLYLPGKTHSLGGPFEMHKMHDFFVKHLL